MKYIKTGLNSSTIPQPNRNYKTPALFSRSLTLTSYEAFSFSGLYAKLTLKPSFSR